MNTVTLVMIYADKIKFAVSAMRLVGVVVATAGSYHVKGSFVFIVLKTYNFFV